MAALWNSQAGKQVRVMQGRERGLLDGLLASSPGRDGYARGLSIVQTARERGFDGGSGGELDISRSVGVDWVQSALQLQLHGGVQSRASAMRPLLRGDARREMWEMQAELGRLSCRILNGSMGEGDSMLWIKSPLHCPTDIEISQAFKGWRQRRRRAESTTPCVMKHC